MLYFTIYFYDTNIKIEPLITKKVNKNKSVNQKFYLSNSQK
jgi:hypothetical protein